MSRDPDRTRRAGQTPPESARGGESATRERRIFAQARGALCSVRDLLRFAVSRFETAGLVYGHGSDNAYDEAAYLILHTLRLPLESFYNSLTDEQRRRLRRDEPASQPAE